MVTLRRPWIAVMALALAGCAVAGDGAARDMSGGGGDASSSCGAGLHLCGPTGECVDSSVCCSSADCTVTGQTCPGIGASCSCPDGKHVCTATNACIPDDGCCVNSDCPDPDQTCVAGSCSCEAGQKPCAARNMCIDSASCCSDSDCPATSQTAGTTCSTTSGACSVKTCTAGWADVNGTYSDGCECKDSGFGQACATPTALGSIAVAGTVVRNGNLPGTGEENWFSVTFAYTTAITYHPHVQLVAPTGATMLMDLSTSCNPTATCGLTGGGALTDWEAKGGGDPTATAYIATPSVGTMLIRVYQTAGPRVCGTYTLTITN